MAIKNKRTAVVSKDTAVEKRLKSKLKEDFESYLKEDDEEEDKKSDFPDEGADGGEAGGEDLGGNDLAEPEAEEGDEEGDEEEVELTPSQEQWMDDVVGTLLEPNIEGHEDELSLEEDGGGDEMMAEADEFGEEEEEEELDLDDDADLDIEDSAEEIDDDIDSSEEDLEAFDDSIGMNDDGEHDLPGGFSAEELNAIIDSPDTLHALEDDLITKAQNIPEEDLEEFESDVEPEIEDDDEDIASEEDELMEADIASSLGSLGFGKTASKTENTFTKFGQDADFKKIDNKGKAKIDMEGWDTEKGPLGDNISTTVKESVKKSKMLVQAAKVILKLQEANKNLKIDNKKLSKVNGIFGAVGEKLSKATRKKITESFSKCKTEKEIDALYGKVAKVITEKKAPTLNEAVQRRKITNVKTVKTTIDESKQAQPAGKKSVSSGQQRINYLMGLDGFDEGYFK